MLFHLNYAAQFTRLDWSIDSIFSFLIALIRVEEKRMKLNFP